MLYQNFFATIYFTPHFSGQMGGLTLHTAGTAMGGSGKEQANGKGEEGMRVKGSKNPFPLCLPILSALESKSVVLDKAHTQLKPKRQVLSPIPVNP